ncbi:glycosyltransferase [Rhodopila sp.]|uniref:glycosyltransferase n=1 Tax=Rhodopila sp. TaxID=2480087 RepID=UPI003D1351A7
MRPSGTGEQSVVALARTAVAHGHAALAAGQTGLALRWLDRAHRLVPDDPNVMLSLASACLAQHPSRAASLFRIVAEKHDNRHAWFGVAAATLRSSAAAAAAEPLASVLAGHAFRPDLAALADQVACVAGAPGWCGLSSGGTLEIHPASPARIEIRLDGKPLRGTRLPAGWTSNRRIDVSIGGRPALGSPIQISRIRRTVGCVEAWQGGIRGWAWHPGDPDSPVVLTVTGPSVRHQRTVHASAETVDIPDTGPLARPRLFSLTADALMQAQGNPKGNVQGKDSGNTNALIHVRGPDGWDLLGSPLDPAAEPAAQRDAARLLARLYPAQPRTAAARGRIALSGPMLRANAPVPAEPVGVDRRKREVTVVIPVHDGAAVVTACLASVLAAAASGTRVLVVDDGSSDAALIATLDNLARRREIRLIRHTRALGFPASANAGILAAAGRDVVLLNSDTLVPQGTYQAVSQPKPQRWLDRLRDAAYSARNIGTVTPLSNDASILSYPGNTGTNPRPDQATTDRLDRLAWRANGGEVVDIPVGVGFCLYLRRDCLNAVGRLRADLFAQGYGEENDFCLRARRLGWRNVALAGLFVGHHGGTSFDTSASHLRARNARIIERLHPGHDALIARFIAQDPLAPARRRIDLAAWSAGGRGREPAVILITHNDGGGVERRIEQARRDHAAAGRRPIVLRPAAQPDGGLAIAVQDGTARGFPNLIYAMPRELSALLRLLRAARPACVEVHHVLGHSPAIHDLVTRLGVPYDVHVHDYAWFCPRLSLLGAHDRYCGEPDLTDCEACVTDLGHFLSETITVAALRTRSARFLAAARAVVAPSNDAAIRMRRHFPGLSPVAIPHEDDAAIPCAGRRTQRDGRLLICVVGGIGVHKGYDVLLACARDAVRRDLNLEFVVVGHTIDDERLLATGRIFVTGHYQPDEAVALITAQHARLGFVPSIWPETWCLSLGDIWRAGLPAAAFDIGAPAERIRATGRGFLLPLGLSAGAINNALVVAAGAPHHA